MDLGEKRDQTGKNFWEKLPERFGVLAPMEDVTDTVFRQMVGRIAPAEVYMTEFTAIDGLLSPGKERVAKRLKYTEKERPLVAQIWGSDPEKFERAAMMVAEMGFDGIDINTGCPQRQIIKCGGGAGLLGKREQMSQIIEAVKKGGGGLPVSVKTRLGMKKIQTEEWIGWLLEQGLAAVTVHLRTVAELSAVAAHWEEMDKIMALKQRLKSETVVVGNGDVRDRQDGEAKLAKWGGDGFMIGRGVLVNPAAFDKTGKNPAAGERREWLREHGKLWEQTWGEGKDFAIMKKFIKAYVNGFDGAAGWRAELMGCGNRKEMEEKLTEMSEENQLRANSSE